MKLSTQIFLFFTLVISISLLDSYVNYKLSRKVNTNTQFLTKSEDIIRNSSRLQKGIIEMQSAFRGFLLTNDDVFLEPYYRNLQEIRSLLKVEYQLVEQSTPQYQKLDLVKSLHQSWIRYSGSLIHARKNAVTSKNTGRYEYLLNTQLKKQVGQRYNDHITAQFRDFDRYEYKVRKNRREALASSIRQTHLFSLLFGILTVIIGLSGTFYIVGKISNRIASMVALAQDISRGIFTFMKDDKNDELTSLSVSLNSMSGTLSRNIAQLQKRNDELYQFSHVVSHDLKAPVRGIYNVVQWIEEDLASEISSQMRKYLDIIPTRIHRMESLIDGLLDYARVGKEKPNKEVVNVTSLIREIEESIVPPGFSIQLKDLPVLHTERILLQQVFSNLISNAVKYTVAKDGQIKISCIVTDDFYEFTVADKGVGIRSDYHDKIFVIFQTLRGKNDKESTGIGLAIVKKIIDDKHCSIHVVSSPGNGAKFIFTWPKN